jgi:hypothetical protein
MVVVAGAKQQEKKTGIRMWDVEKHLCVA